MTKKVKISIYSALSIILIFLIINFFYKYELKNSNSIKIFDKNGIILYELKNSDSRQNNYNNLQEIPEFIKQITIFREDRRFYYHLGVDPIGISRALINGIANFKLTQGASTIDQQDIKLSQKAFSRNISQKINEIFLAININFHYSKDEILLYYMNNLPFGNGIYGFKTACNIYFEQDCQNLSKGELIYLFSLTKFGRQINVSKTSYQLAYKLGLKEYSLNDFQNISKNIKFNVQNKVPFYISYIKNKLNLENFTGEQINTTFDYDLYKNINEKIKGLKPYYYSKNAQDLCAIVMDKNGNIISMNQLKGFDDPKGGFVNYCLSKRQIGSAIKPFLYTFAFSQKILKPDDYILDSPISYDIGEGSKYEPKNFDQGYHGKIKVSQALGNSLNIPAVKILDKIGLPNFWNFMKEIGDYVGTDETRNEQYSKYGLSLALGSKEISPIDFTKMRTIFIKTNNDGNFIQKYGNYINMTKNIISNNNNRLISFGVDNRLNIPGTFAKTGTSRDFVDGRTCGGTQNKIICVWVGNFDNSSMKDSGANTAGKLRNEIVQIIQN